MQTNVEHNELLSQEQYNWVVEQLQGRDIIFASVHGSHLYGLNREGSDIDIKVVYAPNKDDLLLGEGNKTYSKKNDTLNIEMELKSLPNFLKSCKSCDTNCIDLLHTPSQFILVHSYMWTNLRKHRTNLYAKNMKGLISYIKTHTHKYSNKIERYDEMQVLLDELQLIKDETKIKNTTIPEWVVSKGFRFIKNVTVKSDHEQHYIEVCGKKYMLTWESSLLKDALSREIRRYGKRTQEGSGIGLDTKSLSHALRVLLQLKQILEEGTITFPLKNSEYLLDVKLGKVTDPDEVLSKIIQGYDECMELLETCNLPEEVDITPMLNSLHSYYFK